jgi:uncharacterized membrane protein
VDNAITPTREAIQRASKASATPRSRIPYLVTLLVTIAVTVLYFRADLMDRVSTDNSVLQWYAGVQRLTRPKLTNEINATVYPILVDKFSDDGRSIFPPRFKQRMDNYVNYPAPTLIYYAVSSYINGHVVAASDNFASYIKTLVTVMWVPAGAIAFATLFIVLSVSRDRVVAMAAYLSLLAIAAFSIVPIRSWPPHFIWNVYFLDDHGSVRGASNILHFLWKDITVALRVIIHPGPSFSPFAFEPKCNFMVLLVGVFALRWSGSFAASYAVLVVASLFEQGYGMLFALFLAAIDITCEPKRIFNPYAFIFFCLAAFPNLFFGQWWELIGFHSIITILVVGCVLAAAVAWFGGLARVSQPFSFLLQPYATFRASFVRLSTPVGDIALFGLIWFVTLLAFIPISLRSSIYQSQNFWGAIHGRLLGLIIPVLWMSVILRVLSRTRERMGEERTTLRAAAAGVVLFVIATLTVLTTSHRSDPFTRMDSEILEYEAALAEPFLRYDRRTESHLYWAISKSVDTAHNWLAKLLPQARISLPPPEGERVK